MPRRLKNSNKAVTLFETESGLNMNENDIELMEPERWTIITAMNTVLDFARDCRLSDDFWELVKSPLAYLRGELGLTDMQIVVLAVMIEAGEPMSWKGLGKFFGISRLSMMIYSEEIEEMVKKRWFVRKGVHEFGTTYEGFALTRGVVTAIRHNKTFVPEKIDGLSEQEFVDKMAMRIGININKFDVNFVDDEEWMMILAEANPQLPLCRTALSYDDIHVLSLLMMVVFDYTVYANSENEGLKFNTIDGLFLKMECYNMRMELKDGDHILMKDGWIEHKCDNGQVDNEQYVLTRKAKTELLGNYEPKRAKGKKNEFYGRNVKSHSTIKEKSLFYNTAEKLQIEQLTSLLSTDNFPSIQERLEEQGMRKGFACLFYGAPGTGKTETVLQIARQTGRDLMQVDIAGLRDKWVGESEKNIKAVFDNYRAFCKNSEVMPILFFNEADAVINKRMENIEHSVDKMDNAMQNIILQEIENLDGILIATTNLTSNLDNAFERRFLYKVEFNKPNVEAKAQIWRSMLKDISDDDAHQLAEHFDFSGGQIENIARKRTVDYILSGKLASLSEIESYCKAELLSNKTDRHHIAGFAA